MISTLFNRSGTASLCGLFVASLLFVQACSDSNSGEGGISGTGIKESNSPLETYLKNGLEANNSVYKDCFDCLFEIESPSAFEDVVSDGDVSETNGQEAGVDESDYVKTDGEYVYSYEDVPYAQVYLANTVDAELTVDTTDEIIAHNKLNIFSLDDSVGTKEPVNSLSLEQNLGSIRGLFLHNNEDESVLAIMSDKHSYNYSRNFWLWTDSQSQVKILDTSSPEDALPELYDIVIDGQYVSSRKLGNTLVIVSQYSAYIDDFLSYPETDKQIEKNVNLINETSIERLLPQITINGNKQTLIGENDCHIPGKPEEATQPTLAIVTTIDLEDPEEFRATCVAAPIHTIYASTENIFLVEDKSYGSRERLPTSNIYQIGIGDGVPQYKASGGVAGMVGWNQQYRLSEHDGVLRVVTSIGTTHQLHQLELYSGDMNLISSLPNTNSPEPIGEPGEAIYSVRFYDDRAYVVTFRTIDPFYVIDLSDPLNPSIAGELKLPGFSTYLHPFNENLVFGFGRGSAAGIRGDWLGGLKMALFDVSDPVVPVVKDEIIIGETYAYSPALYDPKALSFLSKDGGSRWQASFPAKVYDEDNKWKHDALYLLDFTMAEHDNGEGMSLHGAVIGAERDLSDTEYESGAGVYYDRGIFAGDLVHYLYGGKMITAHWLSESLNIN